MLTDQTDPPRAAFACAICTAPNEETPDPTVCTRCGRALTADEQADREGQCFGCLPIPSSDAQDDPRERPR